MESVSYRIRPRFSFITNIAYSSPAIGFSKTLILKYPPQNPLLFSFGDGEGVEEKGSGRWQLLFGMCKIKSNEFTSFDRP